MDTDQKQFEIASAATDGNLETVQRLAVDPDLELCVVLENACQRGHTTIVAFLLDHPRLFSKLSYHIASEFRGIRRAEIATKLLGEYLDDASFRGHADIVALLLKDPRTDPSRYENTAVTSAARKGHKNIVQMLLEDRRADPAIDSHSALWTAAWGNHSNVVNLLLDDPRVDPSTCGTNSPIEGAAKHKNVSVLSRLIKYPRVYTSPVPETARARIEPALIHSAWSRRRHVVLARALRARM